MSRNAGVVLCSSILGALLAALFLYYFVNNFDAALPRVLRGEKSSSFFSVTAGVFPCGQSAVAADAGRVYFFGCEALGCKSPSCESSLYLSEEGYQLHRFREVLFEGAWGLSSSADGQALILWKQEESSRLITTSEFRAESSAEGIDNSAALASAEAFLLSVSFGDLSAIADGNFERRPALALTPLRFSDPVHSVSLNNRQAFFVLKREQGLFVQRINLRHASFATDVNGDGAADLLTFEKGEGAPYWRLKLTNGLDSSFPERAGIRGQEMVWRLGDPNGVPVPCDYDGDGSLDLATYSPGFPGLASDRKGNWQIFFSEKKNSNAERFSESRFFTEYSSLKPRRYRSIYWGFGRARAMPADYDGDGACDIAVFEPETAVWRILLSGGGFNRTLASLAYPQAGQSRQWGLPGDIPLTGDLDGDSCADLLVVREAAGELLWFASFSPCLSGPREKGEKGEKGEKKEEKVISFGQAGDLPFVADFDGDGKAELMLYRKKEGKWLMRLADDSRLEIAWGVPGGEPFIGDFDGDEKWDLAFFSPSEKEPYRLKNSRYSDSLSRAFRDEPPAVTKLAWGRGGGVPVQILLRRHQSGLP